MTLPESVLAFNLPDRPHLEKKGRQYVFTGVSNMDTTTLFRQEAISLRKFFVNESRLFGENALCDTAPIKADHDESVYVADNCWTNNSSAEKVLVGSWGLF